MGILAIAVVTVYGGGVIWIWMWGSGGRGSTFYTGKTRKTEYGTHTLTKTDNRMDT